MIGWVIGDRLGEVIPHHMCQPTNDVDVIGGVIGDRWSDKKLNIYKTNIQKNIQLFLVKNYNIIKLIHIDLYKKS